MIGYKTTWDVLKKTPSYGKYPIIYKVFMHPRWFFFAGFLNHQQYPLSKTTEVFPVFLPSMVSCRG